MFYFLSKLLPMPCYPLGLGVILLLAAVTALILRRARVGLILVAVAVGELWFFSTSMAAHMLMRPLESRYENCDPPPRCSTIVLLGGGEEPQMWPRCYPEINEAGDRILHAARLYKQGLAPRILTSAGYLAFFGETPSPLALIDSSLLAELFGVDPASILVEKKSKNTHDHGPLIREMLEQRGLPLEIILVTSAQHMPRAAAVFMKNGFTVHPAQTDYRCGRRNPPNFFRFLPSAAKLEESTQAFKEYYGLLAYRILGWI